MARVFVNTDLAIVRCRQSDINRLDQRAMRGDICYTGSESESINIA